MNKWLELISVLRQGAMVANPVTWKNRQNLFNALGGFMVAAYTFARAAGWIQIDVSTADILDMATGIAAIGGVVFNVGATVATTDKIGLPSLAPAPTPELREPTMAIPNPHVPPNIQHYGRSSAEDNGNPFLQH